MWEVKLKHKDRYNCFQNIIYTMSSFYNTNYQMMMLELWGFKYNYSACGAIGDKLSLCWLGNLTTRSELLEKYHGFGFDYKKSKENLIGEISNSLKISPVGVYIDSFICDWVPFYRKQHRGHICLLLGEEENKYLFIDGFCMENEIKSIDKIFIEKNCKDYVTFYKNDSTEVHCSYYFTEINKVIRTCLDNNMFEQYEKFIYDMINKLDLSVEICDNNDPIQSKLIMYLKNISDDRFNFIEALEYIERNTNLILTEPKEYLLNISKGFEMLRAYLIKCSFTRREPDHLKIKLELSNIIEMEKKLFCYLSEIKLDIS